MNKHLNIAIFASLTFVCGCASIGIGEFRRNDKGMAYYIRHGAKGKLTLKIVDDDGVAVADAKVGAHFQMHGRKGITGTSDKDGLFTMQDYSQWKMHYGISKEGWYDTAGGMTFYNHDGVVVKNGRYQPWNPVVTSVLRRISNPIPMYAKIVDIKIPDTDQLFGYDLMAGDWVKPIGNGVVSDFVFKIEGTWANRDNDSTLSLMFSNKEDGIKKVNLDASYTVSYNANSFLLVREAEKDGYQNIEKWRKARKTQGNSLQDEIIDDLKDRNTYTFRIRRNTNILYGKIRDVNFRGVAPKGKSSWIKFTYYLNPVPDDRNLEFDPRRNLFKHLSSLEEVSVP